jgi:anti-sigma factor RsiW
VVELVSDYIEGALSRSDRRRFEVHLRKCPNCSNYLVQMRATIRATGTLHPDDLSPQAQTELTDLFRAWRDGERPSGP